MIEGVQLVPLEVHMDDRGYVIEIIRASDPYLEKFGQVYFVASLTRGSIRAFHKHRDLWDYFFVSRGSAKFALRDDRPDLSTYEQMETHVIGEHRPALLVVPAGVYHGWMALEDGTQLVSTASEIYNRENPDEERVPPDSWGYTWDVQGR